MPSNSLQDNSLQHYIEQLKNMDRNQLILTAAKLKKDSLAEPLAVVGIGCRFASDIKGPSRFWQSLSEGLNSVAAIDNKRWQHHEFYSQDPDEPGKYAIEQMALLDQHTQFDAPFFNIHQTEADLMDPQQRWLLEDTWHALEDANINPQSLQGKSVGIFVGLTNHDYEHLQHLRGNMAAVSGYSAVGSATSVSAGRIAYFMGTQGPTLTLDTACSSSLVSIHLACQALRNGECEMALAGGVNAILSPTTTIAESKAQMLSVSGQCHTYDQHADGYVRGEGCGMVVLKRLSAARKQGDRIYAVIRGSAVNQDGASQGLTSPNGIAQQTVINKALEQADIHPGAIGFVETHGTGTPLGDPIEIQALGEAYQAQSRSQPLYISSLKTNIGHTESTAGVAGFIKLCLSRHHSTLVKHCNLKQLNHYIDLSDKNLTILDKNIPWPSEAPFGAVSSFGFSGTNAHLIIGPAPQPEKTRQAPQQTQSALPELLVTSANSLESLQKNIAALTALVEKPEVDTALAAYASHHHRAHLALRTAWRPGQRPQLPTSESYQKRQLCALFTGQGSQCPGMGQALYQHLPVFRAAVDRCDQVFEAHYGFSIQALMWGERTGLLAQTQFAQPALFTFEYAMMQLWHHWGARPHVLIGHSIGEYAAACYAGVFSETDAMKLIIARGELMQKYCAPGVMLAVALPLARVEQAIADTTDISICVINGPESIVIGGSESALAPLEKQWQQENIRCKRLNVSHAFHSHMMAPMLAEFTEVANDIKYSPPSLPILSSSKPHSAAIDFANPTYWIDHIQARVEFYAAAKQAFSKGSNQWLELGPMQTLCGLVRSITDDDSQHHWLGLQYQDSTPVLEQLTDALAQAYTLKWNIDWHHIDDQSLAKDAQGVELPLYAFDQQHYWFEEEPVFSLQQVPLKAQDNNLDDELPAPMSAESTNQQVNQLKSLDTENQWLTLVSITRRQIGAIINVSEEEVPLDVDLFDLGLDSMKAMDLRAKVQEELGYSLSARLLFDYPNVIALVDYFGIELLQLWEASPVAEEIE